MPEFRTRTAGENIFPPIPLETVNAAKALFGSGNFYLVIGDRIEALFEDVLPLNSLSLMPVQSRKLALLYLCTLFQHLEALPDHLAVDALRERLDWKYALHSSLKPGLINPSMLCDFRKMVVTDPGMKNGFQILLGHMNEIPQVIFPDHVSQDASQVLSHVCTISRLGKVWETINTAMEALATADPGWLRANSLPHWYERYSPTRRKINLYTERHALEELALEIGRDGLYLLEAINGSRNPKLACLPEVYLLEKTWLDQYERPGEMQDEQPNERICWRVEACAFCSIPGRMRIGPWGAYHPPKGGDE